MSTSTWSYFHRVSYAECTLGNHVYYARYLDLLEKARGEFFRHLGKPLVKLQEEDAIFPVVEAQLKYHAPARYDDLLETKISIARMDRIRLGFAYRVYKESGPLILDAESLHVCTSVSNKPRRIPTELQVLLAKFKV
ncbi:MAG: acyl-CoA thioesterase [Verrucomicrobiales bacterium]|nr:acyl-CoA thioesterase [Verrucomicrobiales bacterium]